MGGGTSSYQEIEETDCILLWGSNARETHPIFFHHLLAGLKRGAKLYAIDPRRTASAQFADVWAGLDIGTDIALSNTMAREIITSGLANQEFIDHATTGFDAYRTLVEPWTLAAGAFESEGTVTNSERRVQRVRKTLNPPGEAREDLAIICDLARRMGHDWVPDAEAMWNEVRQLSPMHAGMSYARLEQHSGLQWPCYDDQHPGELFLHGRLWERPVRGPRAPFSMVIHELPLDELTADYPYRLTTGRRLAEYNTGVQTGAYASPTRRGETIDVSPEDARRLGLEDGQRVRVTSRRGAVVAPVRIDQALRPGLTFMTFHFPDDVATNMLTSDATDPRVGTAEFKATAVRIERA
jgi:predicted molibdopterin-dependent oxidoreductase YjgC